MAFDQLDRLQVTKDSTRSYKFDSIDLGGEGTPTLVVRVAGEANPGYYGAAVKAGRDRRGKDMSNLEVRVADAKLLARHCAVSWSNFYDRDARGQLVQVDFDSLKCEEFLVKLAEKAPDLFMYFQIFVGDPANFRDAAPVDGVGLGKT